MTRPIQKVLFIEPGLPGSTFSAGWPFPVGGRCCWGPSCSSRGWRSKWSSRKLRPITAAGLPDPTLVCISSISSTAPGLTSSADFYRQQGLPVVSGGAHPSFLPLEGLEHADYVICGEGDEALPELVDALNHGGSLAGIHNLCYRDGNATLQNSGALSWGPGSSPSPITR